MFLLSAAPTTALAPAHLSPLYGMSFLALASYLFSSFFYYYFFPSFSFFQFNQLHDEKFVWSCYPCEEDLKRNSSRRTMGLLVNWGSALVF